MLILSSHRFQWVRKRTFGNNILRDFHHFIPKDMLYYIWQHLGIALLRCKTTHPWICRSDLPPFGLRNLQPCGCTGPQSCGIHSVSKHTLILRGKDVLFCQNWSTTVIKAPTTGEYTLRSNSPGCIVVSV